MKAPIQFIETICFENSQYPLLQWHQKRMDRTFQKYFPGFSPHSLSNILPPLDFSEKYKVRVVYDAEQTNIEFAEYQLRKLEKIATVEDNSVSYPYKYLDRQALEKLFALRGDADEILIVKKGYITDSFFANVAFWDGSHWYTPDTFLLNGVRRQSLIASGHLLERSISINDLNAFQKISLINAMVELGTHELPVSSII